MATIEQQGIQGNILCGYGNAFGYGLFAFFQIGDADAGRALLRELRSDGDGITNAVPWAREKTPWYRVKAGQAYKPAETRNVAFTYEGLLAIGVPRDVLEPFPDDFKDGMAAKAGYLGDTGPSAPTAWEAGLRPEEPHLLVTITAQKQELRDARLDWLRGLEAEAGSGVKLVAVETELLGHPKDERTFGREHFGFADGVSQPTIAARRAGPNKGRGKGTPRRLGWNDVAPGEFVLGYPDEEGVVAGESLPRRLARNGSFAVVRKLHQDVLTFNRYLRDAAERHEDLTAELIAAKIVGRWPSGAALALAPDADDHALTATGEKAKRMNNFRYGGDGGGLKCPVGAHVRRANPRDALGWQGKLTKRHRIIRRGMPYGPPPAEPLEPDPTPVDRGLMFVCYQASIERQFEVIQGRWMNDGDVFGLGSDKDFLVSGGEPQGKLAIPWKDGPPTLLAPQPRFVTTKGGGYFFAPGISALERLANGEPFG